MTIKSIALSTAYFRIIRTVCFQYLAFYFGAATATFATENISPSAFDVGIEAYEQGNYTIAKAEFLASLEKNETAAARHNLGLTELQLDQPAQAAWQLERALLLDPFNRDYREKLDLVRKQLGLAASPQEWYLSFSQAVSTKVWLIVATVSFWLLLALVIVTFSSVKKASVRLKLLRLFSLSMFLLSLTAIWLSVKTLKTGIVISEETTPLHAAPATAAPESGFARPGERAYITDRHNNFYRIETEGSATGWISEDAFQPLILKGEGEE